MTNDKRDSELFDNDIIHFGVLLNLLFLAVGFYYSNRWIVGTYSLLVFVTCLGIKIWIVVYSYRNRSVLKRYRVHLRNFFRFYKTLPIYKQVFFTIAYIPCAIFAIWVLVVFTGLISFVVLFAYPVFMYYIYNEVLLKNK